MEACAPPCELLFLIVPVGPQRVQPAGETLSLLMFCPLFSVCGQRARVSDGLKRCLLAVYLLIFLSFFFPPFLSPAEGFGFKSTIRLTD